MTRLEIWLDGIPAPFVLEYRERDAALAVRNRVALEVSNRETDGPFKDDFGRVLGVRLKRIVALLVSDVAPD